MTLLALLARGVGMGGGSGAVTLERFDTAGSPQVIKLTAGDVITSFMEKKIGASGSVYLQQNSSGITIIGPLE